MSQTTTVSSNSKIVRFLCKIRLPRLGTWIEAYRFRKHFTKSQIIEKYCKKTGTRTLNVTLSPTEPEDMKGSPHVNRR